VVPSAGNSPFSGVVRVGILLFVAGQIGVDSAKAGVAGETASALIHIRDLLRQSGSSLDRVAKCTVMLADMKDWAAMNEAYIKFFAPNKRPARSSFGTTGLALGARLEIECIATVD
jgi:enamine deaminase RidA (YjgF/YER057c/UK114 family)